MKRPLHISALAAALGAALAAAPASSGAGELIVGVETTYYLPHYAVDGANYIGLGRELFDTYAKDSGETVTYRPLPIKRLFAALVEKEIDIKYPDNAVWAPDVKQGVTVVYSKPLVPFTDGLAVKPELVGKPEAVDGFGMVLGFTPWEYKDQIAAGRYKVTEVGTVTSLIQMVSQGRIAAAYGNVDVIRRAMADLKIAPDTLTFDKGQPHTSSHYHASSVRNPAAIAKLDAWVTANTGKLAALLAKFDVIDRSN